jgi:hypothetical protein
VNEKVGDIGSIKGLKHFGKALIMIAMHPSGISHDEK